MRVFSCGFCATFTPMYRCGNVSRHKSPLLGEVKWIPEQGMKCRVTFNAAEYDVNLANPRCWPWLSLTMTGTTG